MEALVAIGIVALIAIGGCIAFAIVGLTVAVNRLALQRERQADESLKAQQAVVAELRQLREALGIVKVKVLGRVVTGKP